MNTTPNPVEHLVDAWPLDLLIDYILKVHHRGIRANGPVIEAQFRRVLETQADNADLKATYQLFCDSLADLDMHLMKEENVLFPFVLELFEAAEQATAIEQMHCGSVQNPIHVMEDDHAGEVARYNRIATLTNDFTAPEGASAEYVQLMSRLADFMKALHEHIRLENDHLFPASVALEQEWVR